MKLLNDRVEPILRNGVPCFLHDDSRAKYHSVTDAVKLAGGSTLSSAESISFGDCQVKNVGN